MDELTKKKRIRAGHRGSATKIVTKIKERLTNYNAETDKNELKQLRDSLKDKVEALKNLDAAIVELLSMSKEENAAEELAKEIEESDDNIAEMQKVILNVSDITSEAIVQSATVSNDTLNSSMSSETKKTIRAKLPKLEARKFGVRLQEWQEFWDSFDSAVNQNEGLADVDKSAYLKSLLIEPARSAISGFALTSASYNEAIDLLKRRYGKKNAIQKAHIQELMNIKPVSNDRDTEKLRKLYDTCETNYRGLKALGVNETAYSTIVVPEILEKLPETFRLTITRDKDFLEWSMTEVMDAFLKEIELREAHKPRTEKSESHERRKNNMSVMYSKIEKLIRVIALVKRFISNLKVIIEGRTAVLGTLKVEETMMAECTLIKAAQVSLKSRSDYQQLVSQLGIVERDGVLRRKEYLTNLREFHKVKKGKQSVGAKVGHVVLVFDESLKRGCWSVGRIEGLVMGRDNVARGAKVKVVNKGRTSFINRPVQKLYPLELDTRVSIPAEVDEEMSKRCDVDERKEESIKNDKVSMAGSSREKVSLEGSSRRPRRAEFLETSRKVKILEIKICHQVATSQVEIAQTFNSYTSQILGWSLLPEYLSLSIT